MLLVEAVITSMSESCHVMSCTTLNNPYATCPQPSATSLSSSKQRCSCVGGGELVQSIPTSAQSQQSLALNKAVIDRRLRPRCCHPGSYYSESPKSSPVRPLACNWYYYAQFIAKPKAACALRFSWAATSSNLGL